MAEFDHFLAIDWSGARGARQNGIALAMADKAGGPPYLIRRDQRWSRSEALQFIRDQIEKHTLIGLDLGISLPFCDCGAFFPDWDESPQNARALWQWIDQICDSEPNLGANGFVTHPVAARYFRHGRGNEGDRFHLPHAKTREGRFRVTEEAQRQAGCRPVSNFNLVGAAQVGKASLTGMRMLHQLNGQIAVWPIDPLPTRGSAIVEIYTALAAREAGITGNKSKLRDYAQLDRALENLGSPATGGQGQLDDHSSDALLSAAWLRKVAPDPARWQPAGMTDQIAQVEGWTFGAQ